VNGALMYAWFSEICRVAPPARHAAAREQVR